MLGLEFNKKVFKVLTYVQIEISKTGQKNGIDERSKILIQRS